MFIKGVSMSKRILIMGLPGSGKTTLASKLSVRLSPDCLWLNADVIRERYDDWDFSLSGRIRQAERMRELAGDTDKDYIICDFIAPSKQMRDIFKPDLIIWMNTVTESRFADTDKIFEAPVGLNVLEIQNRDSFYWSDFIIKNLPYLI